MTIELALLSRVAYREQEITGTRLPGTSPCWRVTEDGLQHRPPGRRDDPLDRGTWVREAEAVTVVAHAQHGRLGLVREFVDALPRALATLLTHPVDSVFLVDLPIAGALLLRWAWRT